ncbi:MAG TPA: L-glutamate gamma-semialdehyde dehydrogenase [Chloroflexota bacterium]|nr:L-glutamate gamma-semialdehyde dehydrogenase [Chloroflexota bacterium]
MLTPFRNEPLTDFAAEANRAAFEAALRAVDGEADREWPLVIGGERVATGAWIEARDPAAHGRRVGRVAKAGRSAAERALAAAEGAAAAWAAVPPDERARVLLRAASVMRRRKHELSATMVAEIGKTWPEADADTAEAIDFCEYYAREMLRLGGPQPLAPAAGTASELLYQPIGVGLVVSPWNFPCAIATGMVVGPVVAGNPVVFKPSSLTPVIGAKVMAVLEEAGLPPGVVGFLPGSGEEVGDCLVAHPRVRFVSFTGSRDVGVRIYAEAAKVRPGQRWLKRVVAEMGGKNAIVVDDGWADLDAAAAGVVTSAFGFSGQKCSACSRLIAVDAIHDRLLERVVERTEALRVGSPRDPSIQMGPVAGRDQWAKVTTYIDIGREEGRLATGGGSDDADGWYVEPTVFAEVDPKARIAQEEIFGPVLAVVRARDFEHALEIANDTEYALTGALYARDPLRLARARREFQVGNLYLNRKCTGARVGVEPFGGFKMSGTNAKAGGPDYLGWFLDAKAVSEAL